jgi:uncharacterized cupredoxin-like copper-binding protein
MGFSRLPIRTLFRFSFLLLAAGLAYGQEPQLVTLGLVDDRFVPDKLSFRAGVPYKLRLENRGREMHEFTAPEFIETLDVKNPEVLEQAGNEVLVQPGKSKDLVFVAKKPGRYPLTCADHDWDGMVGEIAVE